LNAEREKSQANAEKIDQLQHEVRKTKGEHAKYVDLHAEEERQHVVTKDERDEHEAAFKELQAQDRSLFFEGADGGVWSGQAQVELQGHEITPSGYMVYELEAELQALREEVRKTRTDRGSKDSQTDSLRQALRAKGDALDSAKRQLNGMVKAQKELLKRATESTTSMYHADLSAFTKVLEAEAGEKVTLLAWNREVEDEYLRLCTTLAPELPYPVPSRPVAERKVVESHVKVQARVLCTLRGLAVAAGGKHAELPEGGRKLLGEYEAIQARLGVAGGPADLEIKVVDLIRSTEGAGGGDASSAGGGGGGGPSYQSEHMKSALEGELEELKASLARARRENAKLKKAGGGK